MSASDVSFHRKQGGYLQIRIRPVQKKDAGLSSERSCIQMSGKKCFCSYSRLLLSASVICSCPLFVPICYLFLSVICPHLLFVPVRYLSPSVICSRLLFVPVRYLFPSVIVCVRYLFPSVRCLRLLFVSVLLSFFQNADQDKRTAGRCQQKNKKNNDRTDR